MNMTNGRPTAHSAALFNILRDQSANDRADIIVAIQTLDLRAGRADSGTISPISSRRGRPQIAPMKALILHLLLCLCLFAAGNAAWGAESPRGADLESWQADRFGLFIHWGPVSLKGTEIGWSRAGERRGLNRAPGTEVPVEIYDNLFRQFNPVHFNAKEWVAIAQAAGMKYLVFTTDITMDSACSILGRMTTRSPIPPARFAGTWSGNWRTPVMKRDSSSASITRNPIGTTQTRFRPIATTST
jgi:hypothetical protein